MNDPRVQYYYRGIVQKKLNQEFLASMQRKAAAQALAEKGIAKESERGIITPKKENN